MKFCYSCGKTTPGEPLYCHFCGHSFDIKLCPSRHENPRWAEVCSHCGSRNLSEPQRRVPILFRVVAVVVLAIPAIPLVIASIVLAVAAWTLLTQRAVPNGKLITGAIFLGALWAAWGTLPHAVRGSIQALLKRRDRERG